MGVTRSRKLYANDPVQGRSRARKEKKKESITREEEDARAWGVSVFLALLISLSTAVGHVPAAITGSDRFPPVTHLV